MSVRLHDNNESQQAADVSGETASKTFARALGEELRRTREARGWSRMQLVEQLPSGIGDRTLLSYEHGTRQLTAHRLVELCQTLGVDAPTVLARALQRARLYLDNLTLRVDLQELLRDSRNGSGTFRPLAQWVRNLLNEYPGGVAEVESEVVRNLALFIGCHRRDLADYLARFVPEDVR